MTTHAPLTYRPFTRDEIALLPAGSIIAMTWEHDPEPELFRHSTSGRNTGPWTLLTALPQDHEWERWTHDEVYSEHALYAVVYAPE